MSPAARPASGLFADPREVEVLGDLFANIWQVAYVTDDLDRAMETAKERFGVEQMIEVPTGGEFHRGDEQVEWNTRIAMGARGGLIFELIQPVSGEIEFYTRFLKSNHPGSIQPFSENARRKFGKDLICIAEGYQRRIRFASVEDELYRGRIALFQLF